MKESVRTGALRFAVPEVVKREMAAHRNADLTAAHRAIGKALPTHLVRKLAEQFDSLASGHDSISELTEKLDLQVLPLPAVSHDEVLHRLFAHRRPFRHSGAERGASDKGYRDTLIWHSVLELLERNQGDVWFVTADVRDFQDDASGHEHASLHEDLAADLRKLGVADTRFHLAASMGVIQEALCVPQVRELAARIAALEKDVELMARLREAYWSAQDQLDDYTWESIAGVTGSDIPTSHFAIAPMIDMKDMMVDELEVTGVSDLGDGYLSISTIVPMKVGLWIALDRHGLMEYPRAAHRFFGPHEFVTQSGEPEFSAPGAIRETRAELVVHMTARVQISTKALSECQFTWWRRDEPGAPMSRRP